MIDLGLDKKEGTFLMQEMSRFFLSFDGEYIWDLLMFSGMAADSENLLLLI